MSQSFYRKYRPSAWSDVVGQAHVVETLRNAVAADRVAHAYLFAGPRGTGKTSVARLLAKAVNCEHPDPTQRPDDSCENCLSMQSGSFLDLIEIDAASNTSVDDVRELRDKINFSPNRGRYKVYIIDEVHMLSTAAFNALLKTLEEPPPHAIFILATTELHKIPATVLSRCQRHEFRRIPVSEIVARLRAVAEAEGVQVDEAALELIARQSTGSLRDAQSLLDQLASTSGQVQLAWAREVLGTAANLAVLDLFDALAAKDAAAGLDLIHRALDAGSDPRQFARQVVDGLRGLLLLNMGAELGPQFSAEEAERMAAQARTFELRELLAIIRHFNEAAAEKPAWLPSLPLEMAFVAAVQGPAAPAAPTLAASPAPAERPAAPRPAPAGRSTPPMPAPAEDSGMDNATWARVREALRGRDQQGFVAALINSVKTRQLSGDTLTLGFASDLVREKMDKPDNLALLQAVLESTLGHPVRVKCVLSGVRAGDLPPGVDSSGLVATALGLGGEIVDESDLGKPSE